MADPSAATVEEPQDFGSDSAAVAARWISEIELAEKGLKSWRDRAKRIIKRYRDERDRTSKTRRYAILWSNIQTLGPAIYAQTPSAVVGRRFKDADPVGRVASEVLERAINFSVDAYDFSAVMQACRDEYLLLARAQAWVRYVPHIAQRPAAVQPPAPADPGEIAPDPVMEEFVEWEEVLADYVPWEDFGHNPARNWQEVRFVYRRAFMNREELRERFPEVGDRVPLDWTCEGAKDGEKDEQFQKAQVFEVWDRPSKKAYWISLGFSAQPLDVRDDPLGLRDFFPCPRPMYGTLGPTSLVPTPDYVYYQDQAEELDELTGRIDKLTEALKVTGFYAAHHKSEISQLLAPSNENKLIPVESWAAMQGDGGVKGLVEYWPVEQVVAVLKQCVELRKQLIDDIYQITGVADVMRGQSDPDETAKAQGIKAQWGSIRVRDRQKEIERFARDVLRIMGEVIASRFGPDVLGQMTDVQLMTAAEKQQVQAQLQLQAQTAQQTGQPPPPVSPQVQSQLAQPSWEDVMGVLQNAATRMFRIDIETDSTIEPNEQEEKQRRIEFVETVGELMAKSLPVVQSTPELFPVVSESLKFLVRGFRAGREMEDVIDRALDQLQQKSGQGNPQAQQQAQAQSQTEQAKAQAALITAQSRMGQVQNDQRHLQIEAQRAGMEHQVAMAGVQAENARTAADERVGVHQANVQGQVDMHQLMMQSVQKAEQRRLVGEINDTRPIRAPTP